MDWEDFKYYCNESKMGKHSPVMLVLAGSFNPPHFMHLRMLELAKDTLQKAGIRVVGGLVSPTHDHYKKHKQSLIAYQHRAEMVELAVQGSSWIRCSRWEGAQPGWTRTLQVLEALQRLAREDYNEPLLTTKLVCGADLLESFNVPGLWKSESIERILVDHGLVVINRTGSEPHQFIFSHDVCYKYQHRIQLAFEPVHNDVSSTTIRKMVARGLSSRYLLPDQVCDYVEKIGLYKDDS